MLIELREMTQGDWMDVREIYRQGIDTGDATFENEVPDWASWHAHRHAKCRLVAEGGWGGRRFRVRQSRVAAGCLRRCGRGHGLRRRR